MNFLPLVFVCYCSGLWNLIVNDFYINGLNFTAFQYFFCNVVLFNNIQCVFVIRRWYCFMGKVI